MLSAYSLVLLAYVVLSWATLFGFRPPVDGPVRALVDLLHVLTQPVLGPLRSMMPPVRAGGVGLDLSVVAAFVILWIAQSALGC
ncbi:MAG: YggT family protein [Actinomycetota bacterium]